MVVVGALGVSTTVPMAAGPTHGSEGTSTTVEDCVGHAGGYSALGFAALGRRTAVVGHVGGDPFGRWVRQELTAAGIDTAALDDDPAGTARSVNLMAPDGSRRTFYDGRGHLAAPVPAAAATVLAGARLAHVHLANWARHLLPVARAAGAAIAVDLQDVVRLDDPYRRDFVEAADVLFFSTVNFPDPRPAVEALVGGRPGRVVVAGMGAQGCALGTTAGVRFFPAVDLDLPVVDTNGAGDALAAGFLTAYVLEGRSLEDAIDRGRVAARWNCAQRSSTDLIRPAELDRLSAAASPP